MAHPCEAAIRAAYQQYIDQGRNFSTPWHLPDDAQGVQIEVRAPNEFYSKLKGARGHLR